MQVQHHPPQAYKVFRMHSSLSALKWYRRPALSSRAAARRLQHCRGTSWPPAVQGLGFRILGGQRCSAASFMATRDQQWEQQQRPGSQAMTLPDRAAAACA